MCYNTAYLFAFVDNYQVLNELIQNLRTHVPRVKINDLKKDLHKFTSWRESKKSNHNNQSSVLTDVSEMQFDSSTCITSSINVSVTSKSKYN